MRVEFSQSQSGATVLLVESAKAQTIRIAVGPEVGAPVVLMLSVAEALNLAALLAQALERTRRAA